MIDTSDGVIRRRLSRSGPLWAILTPSVHDAAPTWQLELAALGRGGKTQAVFLKTSALRPLATVTIKGEAYPLLIGWQEQKRGILTLGGERKIGADGERLAWEMRWKPMTGADGGFDIELRLRASGKRRDGHVHLTLPVALHQPEAWPLNAANLHGHCAETLWSAYSKNAVGFAGLESDAAGWDAEIGAFAAQWRGFPLGGGRAIRFGLHFGASEKKEDARVSLVALYAALADGVLTPLDAVLPLDPRAPVAAYLSPEASVVKGAERVYLKSPNPADDACYAGFPHFPADALHSLWAWNQCHPDERIPRLIRYGARGLAADFQVMGKDGQPEPNKGAFWDRMDASGKMTDGMGAETHGIASNARLARAFFLLHGAMDEPLLYQSALNICQWLLLKQNESGWFDGARVFATRGCPDDGKFLPNASTLDGADALRAFVGAFRATGREVWIKAAWKIAEFLLRARLLEFDAESPAAVASVLLGLRALDAESPNARLRGALRTWGDWLRALPLPAAPDALYECARAAFEMHTLEGEGKFLRYAFAALAAVPADVSARAWQAISLRQSALLALATRLPGASVQFDSLSVSLGWRVFSPDPAAQQFLHVQSPGGQPIDCLPLVCRLNDQMLLIVLAPPDVPSVCVLKNGRRPLLRDLQTDTLDTAAELHLLDGQSWARVGLFTLDP